VRVDWGQPGLTPASDRVPPVFDGERVRVYALADALSAGTAALRGTVAGRAVAFEIPIDPAAAVEGDTIATLAARARIRTIEEEGEYLEGRRSRQRRARSGGNAAAGIVALAVKYQLASRETSFVAIEHRDAPLAEHAALRRVPVALTSGWGGLREARVMSYLCAPQMDMLALGPAPASQGPRLHGPSDMRAASAEVEYDDLPAADGQFSRTFPARARASRTAPVNAARAMRPLDVLVALQRADGSWELDGEFAKAVSLELRGPEQLLGSAVGDPVEARRALATAIALEWLEKHAAGERGQWELLALKATRWLSSSHAEPAAGQGWNAWLDVARRLL